MKSKGSSQKGLPFSTSHLNDTVNYKKGYLFNQGENTDLESYQLFAGGQVSRHVNLD